MPLTQQQVERYNDLVNAAVSQLNQTLAETKSAEFAAARKTLQLIQWKLDELDELVAFRGAYPDLDDTSDSAQRHFAGRLAEVRHALQ